MKRIHLLALGGFAIALCGCGDPAPSTAIAPDLPGANSKATTPPGDLSKMKEAEHGTAPADRK